MTPTRRCVYPMPTPADPLAVCGQLAEFIGRNRPFCDEHAAVVVDQMGWSVARLGPPQGDHLVKCPHCQALEVDPRSAQPECRLCGFTGSCTVCGGTVEPQDYPWADVCSPDCNTIAEAEQQAEAMLDDERTGVL